MGSVHRSSRVLIRTLSHSHDPQESHQVRERPHPRVCTLERKFEDRFPGQAQGSSNLVAVA